MPDHSSLHDPATVNPYRRMGFSDRTEALILQDTKDRQLYINIYEPGLDFTDPVLIADIFEKYWAAEELGYVAAQPHSENVAAGCLPQISIMRAKAGNLMLVWNLDSNRDRLWAVPMDYMPEIKPCSPRLG